MFRAVFLLSALCGISVVNSAVPFDGLLEAKLREIEDRFHKLNHKNQAHFELYEASGVKGLVASNLKTLMPKVALENDMGKYIQCNTKVWDLFEDQARSSKHWTKATELKNKLMANWDSWKSIKQKFHHEISKINSKQIQLTKRVLTGLLTDIITPLEGVNENIKVLVHEVIKAHEKHALPELKEIVDKVKDAMDPTCYKTN